VARAIEELEADRLNERAPLLARHWEQAGDERQAARWHARAAEAAGYVDVPDSLFHWRRVRSLAARLPESAEMVDLQLRACSSPLEVGGRAGLSMAEATALFEEGEALARRADDLPARVRLNESLAARLGWSGDPAAQRRHLAEAARLAEQVPDLELKLVVSQRSAVAKFHEGDLGAALALATRGIERAEADADYAVASSLTYRGLLLTAANALAQMGDLEQSAALLDRVDALSGDPEQAHPFVRTAHTRALVRATLAFYRGEVEAGLREARAFAALAQRSGSTWAEPVSALALGRALLLAERWGESLETLERSIARARELRLGLDAEAAHLGCLAEACAGCADAKRASSVASEAISVARRLGTRFWELHAQSSLAAVLLRTRGRDGRAEIEMTLERAFHLIEETGGEVMRPIMQCQRAELAGLVGDGERWARELREAQARFVAMGATGRARAAAARLASGSGSPGAASTD
jgi:tetratricopeptide (TPR) repeat protein